MIRNKNIFGEKNFLNSNKKFFNNLEKLHEKKIIFGFDGFGDDNDDDTSGIVGFEKKENNTKENKKKEIIKKTDEKLEKIKSSLLNKIDKKKFEKYKKTETLEYSKDELDHIEKENLETEDINISSYEKIMSKLDNNNLQNLASELSKKLPENFSIWTHGEIDDILEKAGYESDGILGPWESEMVTTKIIKYAEVQKNIYNKNYNEISKILFDFDEDGDLDVNKRLYVGETQMLKNIGIKNFSEDQFLILMKNIGILKGEENLDNLKTKLGENLFNTRQKIKTQLFRLISAGVKPGALTVKNGLAEFVGKETKIQDKFIENYINKLDVSDKEKNEIKNSIEKIDHDLLKSKIIQNVLEKVNPEYKKGILEKIKLEAIGIMIGEKNGIGASFNYEDFSNNFVESHLALGLVGGNLGFIVTKDVLDFWRKNDEKKERIEQGEEDTILDNISLNVGVANIIPFASLDGEFFKPDTNEIKENFPLEIRGDFSISAYAGGTVGIQALGIGINKIDETTKKGISLMKRNMTGVLYEFTEAIKSGKDFDENFSKLKEKSLSDEEKNKFKEIFSEMKNFYNSVGENKDIKNKFLDSVKDGYLTHYENQLFKNAEGLNFSQVGFGVAFLAGFLPLPFITGASEYKRQEIKSEKGRGTLAEMLTTKTENYKTIETSKINGKQAYEIKGIKEGLISSSNPNLQIEFKNGNAYVSGIDFSKPENQITITNYKKYDGEVNILVIGNGYQEAGRLEISKNHKPITENVKGLTKTTKSHTEIKNLKLVPELDEFKGETKDLIEKMSHVMDKSALKVQGVKNLINIIGEFQLGNENLNNTWNKLNGVIFGNEGKLGSHLLNRSRKKGGQINSFSQLKTEFSQSLNEGQPDSKQINQRKKLILRSIFSNVMKDQRLEGKSLISKKEKNNNKNYGIDYLKYKNFSEQNRLEWEKLVNQNPNRNYPKIPIKYYDTITQPGKTESRSESFSKNLSSKLGIDKDIIDESNNNFYKLNGTEKPSFDVNYHTEGNIIAFPAPSGNEKIIPRTGIIEYSDVDGDGKFNDFVEINKENSKKLIEHLPNETLLNLLNQISKSLGGSGDEKLDSSTKNKLINIIQEGRNQSGSIKIDYTPILFKWGKCFNTTLGIKDLSVKVLNKTEGSVIQNGKLNISHAIINETYVTDNLNTTIGIVLEGEKNKNNNKDPVNKKKPKPEEDGGETTKPGNTESQSNYTNESKIVNSNPNKGKTVGESIDNGVNQQAGNNQQSDITDTTTTSSTTSSGDYGSDGDF